MSYKKSVKRKKHVKRRQRYQLKRAGRKKDYHFSNLPLVRSNPFIRKEPAILPAPKDFNLQYENCVNVIDFINNVKRIAKEKRNITVDLSDVVDIREGAIAMLLSVMKEVVKKYKIHISGNTPRDPRANKILEQSGFFRLVKRRNSGSMVHQEHSKNLLRTGKRKTQGAFLGEEMKKSMDTVWGVRARNPKIRAAIFEMIRNSCDHAFPKNEHITWHLSISHDEEKKLVKFSFVDNGRGIVNTLNISKLKQFMHIFNGGVDMLDTAFTDGIESRTGLQYRGTGLPTIYEMYSGNIIKNFLVITNNAFLHYDKDIKEKLPNSFDGTYYYWEVDQTCTKEYFL